MPKITEVLQKIKAKENDQDEVTQKLFANGVSLLGYSFFSLEKAADAAATGFDLANSNLEQVKQAAMDLASLGNSVKQANAFKDADTLRVLKPEITSKINELTEKLDLFVKNVGKPTEARLAEIKEDTGLEWQKNLIGLKEFNLGETELEGLLAITEKGEKIAILSKALGWLALALGSAKAGMQMYEACKIDPESSSCHEDEVGGSAEVAGGAGAASITNFATKQALKKIRINTADASDDMVNPEDDGFAAESTTEEAVAVDSSTTVSELLGCNLAFDWETLGTGAIGCWIVVAGLGGTAGYYGGKVSDKVSTAIYKKYFSIFSALHK